MPPKRKSMFAGDVEAGKCDNLAELENLNEETLLDELKVRYFQDIIYTYVGEILVAVNPYKEVANLYADSKSKQYSHGVDKKKVPPHLYAVADNAFEAMKSHLKDQVCVISGESGAGKTESAKLFLKQVIAVCPGCETPGLQERIIKVNPLLEAFGNAQTVMNDNSSRFGKYLDLRFNQDLNVKGAIITEYLLEKSRVVHQADGEQNFHIFYYLFAGLDDATKARLQLQNPADHRYVNGNANALKRIRSKEFVAMWKEVQEIIHEVGFTSQEQSDLNAVLAGVLHLGDIDFSGDEAAVLSSNGAVLSRVCQQLGVQEDAVELALTTLTTVIRGEETIRNYKVDQAADCRDAAAKALYDKAFSWIVQRVNTLIGPANKDPADLKISFLDIFGFENFDVNSLEQLCINLANEQLQFFFNNHIFAMELAEYAKEGIDGSRITYEDNQSVLDLIMNKKPPGIISILDEQSSFPKATDQSFVEALHAGYNGHKDYIAPKGNEIIFSVKHYAGIVKYDAFGFLEKNRDTLASDIMAVFRMSENQLVRLLFGGDDEDARSGAGAKKGIKDRGASRSRLRQSMKKVNQSLARAKKKTVGSGFKESLEALMVNLNAAEPHFIRCIKPNARKAPADFDAGLVTKQLRYTGMLETTRIRREGYPVRPVFSDFIYRYKVLGYYMSANVQPSAVACRKILEKSGITGWLCGHSKVFLKYFHVDQLNDKLRPLNGKAIIIQKWVRRFVARKKYLRLLAKKRAEEKLAKELFALVERHGKTTFDAVASLCEQDAKRPADFWAPKPPPVVRRGDSVMNPNVGAPPLPERKKAAPPPESLSGSSGAKFKRAASVKWFKEVEMKKGAGLGDSNHAAGIGGFATWFHGIITRQESEDILGPLPSGSFLVRVSESRFGYSLSFKFKERLKHFMIDQTPDGRYLVVGNDRTFPSLNELVKFHTTHPLTEDGDLLLRPCPAKAQNLQEFI